MNYRSRKYVKRAGVCLLVLLALIGNTAAIFAAFRHEKKNALMEELRATFSEYEKKLYVAVCDMHMGDVVLEEDVILESRYTDERAELYMTQDDIGKVLISDVAAGSCLMKHMLVEEENSLREVFISKIDISGHLQKGNQVDVRISYGNAEDYVVLTGKQLISCDEKEGIVLQMSETEILLLSSALHDCDTYMDTEIYLVKYPEFQRMKESEVTYVPNKEVLMILGRLQEYEKRIRIEERLEIQ